MPGLAPYKAKIQAGKRVTINARGTTVFMRKATGEVEVTVRSLAVGDADGSSYTLRMEQAEEWLHADTFDKIVLENKLAVENIVEMYLGFGRFIKPVPDIVNVSIGVPAGRVSTSFIDETKIDVGQAGKISIRPELLTRTQLVLTALVGNTNPIRIGDTDVDTNRGTPLAPGETMVWDSTAECFACSESVVDQGVAKLEHTIE